MTPAASSQHKMFYNRDNLFPAEKTEPQRSSTETHNSTSGSNSGLHVVSEVAKTCLRALKESSDAFPPLKSLVSGISFFIENYEVSEQTSHYTFLTRSKKWEQNKETLQRLTIRILRLTHDSKGKMGQVNDSAEVTRREELERYGDLFILICVQLNDTTINLQEAFIYRPRSC